MKALLAVEQQGSLEVRTYFDHADGKIHIQALQDVAPALDAIADRRNSIGEFQARRGGLGDHVGSIPEGLAAKFLSEGINIYDPSEARRILNNPDYKKLRVRKGKL